MTIALVVLALLLAVVLAAAIAAAVWAVRQYRGANERLVAHLAHEKAEQSSRILTLEAMLDEARAVRVGVTPPPTARPALSSELEPLHPVLQANLDAIPDEEARGEFEVLIRAKLAEQPTTDPVRLAAEVFG